MQILGELERNENLKFDAKFKVGTYSNLNGNQMRIKRGQPRNPTLIAELIIAHKKWNAE